MISCITFDLDDTLWDTWPVLMRAEEQFYAWLDAQCPRITQAYERDALTAHRKDYFRNHPDMVHDLTWLRKRWLEHILQAHGYHDISADHAFRVFWEHRNAVALFDDARALEGLRARFSLGVITNGNACVEFIGIGHWFDFVVSSEVAGASKPSPDIFHVALEHAGVEPRAVVHVGDDPTNDVVGAAGVGIRTVWYNPKRKPWPPGVPPPDATIQSMTELDDALTRI